MEEQEIIDSKLEELQKRAIRSTITRINDANHATLATRIGALNSLHVAASMDIKNTTESLAEILAYKKEVAKKMLRCYDEKQIEQIAELIKYADDMICKILGIYVP